MDNNINTNNVQTFNQTQSIKNPKKIPIIPIIIAICGLVGFIMVVFMGIVYLKLQSNKKTIVKNEISAVFATAKEAVKEADKNTFDYNLDEETIGIEGTLSIKSDTINDEIDLTKLENYKINYNGSISRKDNEASFALDIKKDKEILNSKIYITDDQMYLNLGDIFSKTLLFDGMEKDVKSITANNINYQDIDRLLTKTEKIVIHNINDADITKTKEKREFNRITKDYTKISYQIDIYKQMIYVLKEYKKDDDIIRILANLNNITPAEVEENINELIAELYDITRSPDYIEENKIWINTYFDGMFNNIKGIEIITEETMMIADVHNKTFDYIIASVDGEVAKGILDLKEKKLTVNTSEEDENINLEVNWKTKNKITGKITGNSEDIKHDIAFTITNILESNTMITSIEMDINEEINEKRISLIVNTDYKIKKNVSVEKLPTNNAVKMEDLSEEEANTLYSNLLGHAQLIIQDIAPSVDAASQFKKEF